MKTIDKMRQDFEFLCDMIEVKVFVGFMTLFAFVMERIIRKK